MFKRIPVLALALSLSLVACAKKDDGAPTKAADPVATAPAPAAPAPVAPAPAAPAPAAPAPAAPAPGSAAAPAPADTGSAAAAPAAPSGGSVTIANYDDYTGKGTDLIKSMMKVFSDDGTNCDKLGDDMTKFMADNADTFAAIKTYENGHKDDKKKFDKDPKAKELQTQFMTAATPGMKACMKNEKLKAAFSKLG